MAVKFVFVFAKTKGLFQQEKGFISMQAVQVKSKGGLKASEYLSLTFQADGAILINQTGEFLQVLFFTR